ncbi:MAG: hypothetical protein BWX47_01900 [candidate division Hyd24-12 bacterium ADurb.Bin004]|nr:MAG: hypothetical protein BWX47_01900 [candidate division Hyd24-12 bacterium ADurb.Bin004]
MSPVELALIFDRTQKAPRWGQPAQSMGGRGGTSAGAAAGSAGSPRPFRTVRRLNSPSRGKCFFPSAGIRKCDLICSSRNGSPSSTTLTSFTIEMNRSSSFQGRGHVIVSLSIVAPGYTSLT